MGKKRGYNARARTNDKVVIDDSESKQIAVDINIQNDKYNDCNTFVLPSDKRQTKKKVEHHTVKKLLSKKKRKRLEQIVQRKQKKLKRADLLQDLAKVQASETELSQYVPLTSVQTKGLKKHFRELNQPEYVPKPEPENYSDDDVKVNAIKGSKKKRLELLGITNSDKKNSDPNVIDLNESESEISGSESENESPEETKQEKEKEEKHNDEIVEIVQHPPEKKEEPKEEPKTGEKSTKRTIEKVERVPATFVMVNREAEIQKERLKLPILGEEQVIVEAINENPVVIITGETGSGKTTQVPQFLYEAGYANERMIGITEPRRVAAISMSQRVAKEMNLTEKEVSYLIRFEGNVSESTKIKFMTDGVLLKEIQKDFLLKKYSVIILDEAHERSVYTDILIGFLTRIVNLRLKKKIGDRIVPLKLIIMSATLRVDDFLSNEKLFKTKPPVINVPTRQFPVTIHYNRTTSEDYLKDALRKAARIHTTLPDGGILIFLTGQREVNYLTRQLRKLFPLKKKAAKKDDKEEKKQVEAKSEDENKVEEIEDSDEEDLYNNKKPRKKKQKVEEKTIELPTFDLEMYSVMPTDDTQGDLEEIDFNKVDSDDEFKGEEDDEDIICDLSQIKNLQPLWVLPLYSLLPSYKQAKVFEPPPEGTRLCVVSTNVAETSLTIPNVKYVIDCGRTKMRLYDKVTGVSTYVVDFTSKAAAQQRAGRSGRTGPGHCYRLYSSAVFNDRFADFSEPEICRKPVDDIMLQLKVMNIDKVVNFPFPTPPGEGQLETAEKRLCILGALESSPLSRKENLYNAKVTDLGRRIASFPVAPRYGKMLALSHQHDLYGYTICIVAALSIQEMLIENISAESEEKAKWMQTRRFWAGTGNSFLLGDPMVLLHAIGAAEYAAKKGKFSQFCVQHGLREKAMIEVRKLRRQLTNEIILNVPGLKLTVDPEMPPPTDTTAKLLRQIILAGNADQIARKIPADEIPDKNKKHKYKHAYHTLEMEDPVFMHYTSVLKQESPEWVVYQEVYETNKTYMRNVTAIEPEWLPKFAPTLCRLSEPLLEPPPRFDKETGKVMCKMTGTFGPRSWPLPVMEMEHPKDLNGVKLFARFLLEGEVCPKLKRFVPNYLATPSSVTKSWSKLISRIESIVNDLHARGIMSKDRLLQEWATDKNFLLSSYKKWLPESAHGDVVIMWPPV